MKKKIVLFILLAVGNVFGQVSIGENSNNYNIDLYPKTPEAYAFAKFVDIPAGSYTGVANFNIPIYTIQVDGLTIPIQLDYSTAGVKVDEIASRVGLGWNLNAGPSLTMQVVGAKDYYNTREIFDPGTFYPNDVTSADNPSYQIAMAAVGNGMEPIEEYKPDIYSYSIGNYSGKFIIDSKNSKGITIPYYPIEIKKQDGTIIIIDDQGNEFFFSSPMSSYNYNTCASVLAEASNSTYILEKILTKNKKIIKYEYEHPAHTMFATGFSEQKKVDEIKAVNYFNDDSQGSGPNISPFCLYYSSSNEPVLKRIKYENNAIEFNYNVNNSKKERQDLPGEVFLEEIIVIDYNGKSIKKFKLNQTANYFVSPSLDIHQDLTRQMNLIDSRLIKGIDKRLKLEEIEEIFSNQKYRLEYYEEKPLINRFSFAQDYWGVYNGKSGQMSSIPAATITNFKGNTSFYGGADKKPNLEYGIIGNLKKIIYPTKGSLTIKYEADQYFKKESVDSIIYHVEKTYNTRSTYDYLDFEARKGNNIRIYDVKLNFTGDNDNGSGVETVGNCYLSVLNKSTNQNIIKNPYQYTLGNGTPYKASDIEGKSFKMSIEKGYDHLTEKSIDCYATLSWIERETFIVPEHNESIGTIRVKNITLDDNNNNTITRDYTYAIPETTKESGTLYGENQFRTFYTSNFTKGDTKLAGKQRIITNNPGWQINTINGKSVLYKYVTETYKNLKKESENYTKLTMYNNSGCSTRFDGYGTSNFIYPICNEAFLQGKVKEEVLKDNENTIVKKTIFDYNEDRFLNRFSSSALPNHSGIEYGLDITKVQDENGFVFAKFEYAPFSIDNAWIQNIRTTTTDFFPNDSIVITTENHYSPTYKHLYPASVTTKNSKNETLTTEYQYPPDLVGQEDYMKELTDANRIAEPVVVKQSVDGVYISEVHNQYNLFNGIVQKAAVHQKKGNGVNIKTTADRKITYTSYDAKGNLTQYTLENGIPVSIIWGYGGQYPIAKIEGASLSEVSSFIQNLEIASNNGTLTKDSFASLRTALPQAMITSYIYQPLVGVTSITGPNGQTEYYNYDAANRLQSIVNDKQEVLKTFEYNYKQP